MPITPVFEQPPVTAHTRGIDWTDVLADLVEHPDEWARVDGPFPNDKKGHSNAGNHGKSLRTWAERADTQVETRKAVKDDEVWVYARTVEEATPTPAPTPATAKKPAVAAVPDPPVKLTIGQAAALNTLTGSDTATESNRTDHTAGLVHWQPLNALVRKGLVEVVGWNGTGRVVALTDTGREVLT